MAGAQLEYDIIFAGGGTSACVAAGRLADADPSLRIMIVEAGPHTQDDLTQPALFLTHLSPTSNTVTFHVANPEKELAGRQTVVACGQCVGGGSSVNFLMYSRPAASDYDEWEETFKNPGWGSKHLIPLLNKCETYEVSPGRDLVHGYSGPLKVSNGGAFTSIAKEFLGMITKYEKARGITDDPNDLFHCNAFARWPKWISAKTGMRSDVAHTYIYNKKRDNITLTVGHLVKRVIFENKRAVGIEFVKNPRVFPDAKSEEVFVARAKRLVVLSSGSFGSPAILERSGIGAKSVLEKCGVKQIVDLPGVGENYQDHQLMTAHFLASEESETIDAILRNEQPAFGAASSQWLKDGQGLMATNGLESGIKLRFTQEELKAIGPAFEKKWYSDYAHKTNKPALWMGAASLLVGDPTGTPSRKYFTIGYWSLGPSSVGFIHIRSGSDPTAPIEFETGYLRDEDDLELLRWGYKKGREWARRMPFFRGEYVPHHPEFSKGSAAFCYGDGQPVAMDAPDIVYTEEDDKAIDQWTRNVLQTAWHSLGTCAMKPREEGGVVDSRLNVYGVEGLKVADLSIPPSNITANTYSTAVVIAEKAAVMIAEDLSIEGV